jgi:hypothetical protein
MNLHEACQSAREGNFVSHHSFDYDQSMHEYKGNLYYEDGANLTADGFIEKLAREKWSNEGWFVKCSKDLIDKEKLEKLHNESRGYMLNGKSYEDCIIKQHK